MHLTINVNAGILTLTLEVGEQPEMQHTTKFQPTESSAAAFFCLISFSVDLPYNLNSPYSCRQKRVIYCEG